MCQQKVYRKQQESRVNRWANLAYVSRFKEQFEDLKKSLLLHELS